MVGANFVSGRLVKLFVVVLWLVIMAAYFVGYLIGWHTRDRKGPIKGVSRERSAR